MYPVQFAAPLGAAVITYCVRRWGVAPINRWACSHPKQESRFIRFMVYASGGQPKLKADP